MHTSFSVEKGCMEETNVRNLHMCSAALPRGIKDNGCKMMLDETSLILPLGRWQEPVTRFSRFALGVTGSNDGALTAVDGKDAKDISSAKQRDIGNLL